MISDWSALNVERRDLDVDERRTRVAHDLQRVLEDRIGLRRHTQELPPYADARHAVHRD